MDAKIENDMIFIWDSTPDKNNSWTYNGTTEYYPIGWRVPENDAEHLDAFIDIILDFNRRLRVLEGKD